MHWERFWIIMNPYIFENGEWKEVRPFSGQEEIDFPPPVGTQTVYCTLHSEEATIPATFKSKGLKNMTFKLALPKAFDEKLRFLVALGLGSKEPVQMGDPQRFSCGRHRRLAEICGQTG